MQMIFKPDDQSIVCAVLLLTTDRLHPELSPKGAEAQVKLLDTRIEITYIVLYMYAYIRTRFTGIQKSTIKQEIIYHVKAQR